MATYIPDETGDLTVLEDTVSQSIHLAQAQAQTGDLGAAFAKMFLTLIALCLLLFLTYWFLRKLIQNKLQKGAENSVIHILEKKMISPKTTLYLVEIENKKILLAESHLEVKKLETLERDSPEVESP